MDLMEYRAKELFESFGLPVSRGFVVDSPDRLEEKKHEVEYPCVVKAQVMIGGRGKAGGIKAANNYDELKKACADILGMDIRGHVVERVLIVKSVDIRKEWYLAITLDRLGKCPTIIFSPMGGVDIEETARTSPEKIVKAAIDPTVGVRQYHAQYLVSKSGIDQEYASKLFALLQRLYQAFRGQDCTLCEINPLAIDAESALIAVDAKVSVDDSALMRYPDLTELRDELERDPRILEARKFRFLYIPCDPAGNLSVISNGSGMIMSCIDAISASGMAVHSALDLGGGSTADRIKEALRIVLGEDKVKGLFINIFGGITRCDEVAGGVAQFMREYGSDKLIVVRFEGTNKDKGMEVLSGIGRDNVVFADGLYQGVEVLNERRASL